MPAGYIRLDVRGSHFSQQIQNTFYYAAGSGGNAFLAFPPELALDCAQAWVTDLEAAWVLNLPTEYNLDTVVASFVDVHGVTDPTSYSQEVAAGSPGQSGSPTTGSADCAIIAFPTSIAVGAALPLKRSYIAYGPVPTGFYLESGALSGAAITLLQALGAALATPVEGAEQLYYPVRVGRTAPTAPIRAGVVIGSFVRTNKRFRASRLVPN